MIFLTEDEIVRLTGKDQAAAQKRYLDKKQIPYEVNAIGEILVSRNYIERRLSGIKDESAPAGFKLNVTRLTQYAAKAQQTAS